MNTKILIFTLLSLLMLNSCATKIPYSSSVEKQYDLSDDKLKALQFYLMEDITLYAATKDGKTDLKDGEIVVNEEANSDKIIIRAGTYGVFEKRINANAIAVAFEDGEGKYLVFSSPVEKQRYTFQPDEWMASGRGKVQYGGKTYVTNSAAKVAYVAVKLRKSSQSKTSQRVAKGKKL